MEPIHDYPPELMDQVVEARKKKRTVKEAQDFVRGVFEVIGRKFNTQVPGLPAHPQDFNHFQSEWNVGEVKILLSCSVRVQGDEGWFMWEPGVPWRSGNRVLDWDSVKVEYDISPLHPNCPNCCCARPGYETVWLHSVQEAEEWVAKLGETR